jgi:hypothetical protein
MGPVNPRTLLLAASGLWLLGCGASIGGSASPGGAFTTHVSGTIPLTALTSEQATQLCNDVNSANTATLQPTNCAAVNHAGALLSTDGYQRGNPAATDAELQMQCAYVLPYLQADGCMTVASCDASMIASSPPACTATVADVVNCINENDAIARRFLADTPTCDVVTASSLAAYLAPGGVFEVDDTASMSASCQALAPCYGVVTLSNYPPPGS